MKHWLFMLSVMILPLIVALLFAGCRVLTID